MKPVAPPIFAPLSTVEARVLRAYVEQDKETLAAVAGAEALAWAEATQVLKWRGFLLLVDRGMLVTPEGLAAALDIFPAELLIRKASQAENAAAPGVSTRPSRGRVGRRDRLRAASPSTELNAVIG